jgi:hypothetical protein
MGEALLEGASRSVASAAMCVGVSRLVKPGLEVLFRSFNCSAAS